MCVCLRVRAFVRSFPWRYYLFASLIVRALKHTSRHGGVVQETLDPFLFPFIEDCAAAPGPGLVVSTDNDALFTNRYTRTLSSFFPPFLHE